MKVTTGYGYIKDSQGNITDKYNLSKGEHPLKAGYTSIEVPDQATLDTIIIYEPPKTIEQQRREKIKAELDQIAKDILIGKGEWPV